MNSLHILTLRYLILLDLLALHQIVKFLWTHDCMTFQALMLSIKHAVVDTRIRAYWLSCQEALDSFNPATYLIEGADEFVLDLSPNKYTVTLSTPTLADYSNNPETTRTALEALSQDDLHKVYKEYRRKLSPAKVRKLTVDEVITVMHSTLYQGRCFL